MKIHRLNDEGLAQFNQYLDLLSSEPTATPPIAILDDSLTATVVGEGIDIPATPLTSRLEAAKLLHPLLNTLSNPETDKGLWAWLSLFFFDSVCPLRDGVRKPGQRYRHIAEVGNYRRYYRHLLLGPFLIYRFYNKNPDPALSLLWQPVDKPGDVVGQIAAYQELVTNLGVVETATNLYFDKISKREKKGAQNKQKGGARALVTVLNQFDVTWDLYGMSSAEIGAMLPKEFSRFQATR